MGKKTGILYTVIGTLLTVAAGWYVVKGPFLGLATPPPMYLLGGTAVFIGGIILLGIGVGKYVSAFGESERPTPTRNKT